MHPSTLAPALSHPARLTALRATGLLDTPAEEAFDRATRLAARLLRVPVALVTLVDGERAFLKSCLGLPEPWPTLRQLPLTHSFCPLVVQSRAMVCIADAHADPRAAGSPAVSEMGVRAYLGVSLCGPDGEVLGSVCVTDRAPREWTDEDRQALCDVAAALATEVALRMRAAAGQAAEAALGASEARYRTLVEQIPAITYVASADEGGATLYSSPQTSQILGFTPDEWIADPRLWLKRIHPADRERVEAEWARAHAAGERFACEYRLLTRDGRVLWFQDEAVKVLDEGGAPLWIQGVMFDVTQRRGAEAAVRRSEESIRALHQITAARGLDFGAKVRALLEMGCRRFGLPRGELLREAPGALHVVEGVPTGQGPAAGERISLPESRPAGAYLGTPVSVAGEPYGVLRFHGGEVRAEPFTESEWDFLRLMAQWVGSEMERSRAEAALRESEGRYRELVEDSIDVIYRAGPDGRFSYVNRQAVRLLGRWADELVGTSYLSLVRPDWRERVREVYVRQWTERTPTTYLEFPMIAAGGREVWMGQNVTLVMQGGVPVGVQALARDVTERREMDRIRDEFVSMVSHELRTPLTALRASLGLLRAGHAGPLTAQEERLFAMAVRNTDRLVRLIHDILDVEHLESGQATLERVPVPALRLVADAVETVRGLADDAGVRLEVAVADGAVVHADADRAVQTLVNLLGNAVKFSPAVSVVRVEAEPVPGQVLFRVRDEGRGIPADKLEQVFERFRQVDSSDTREKGGTGLGLAICRRIVEQHGGRIWAESEPGRGSVFSFTLPRWAEPDAVSPAADPEQASPRVPAAVQRPSAAPSDDPASVA
ncbi:MAG: domain S-box [Gemmatimonadetes bacterium]|nr:domain S-box [Gemmatimonadota bacterium]